MSDNPSESTELLNLNVNVETDAAQQKLNTFFEQVDRQESELSEKGQKALAEAMARVNAQAAAETEKFNRDVIAKANYAASSLNSTIDPALTEVRAHIGRMQEQAEEAFSKGNEDAVRYLNDLIAIKDASYKTGAGIKDLRLEVEMAGEEFERLNEIARQTQGVASDAQTFTAAQIKKGYGAEGGMIGPREPSLTERERQRQSESVGPYYTLGFAARSLGQITGQDAAGNLTAHALSVAQGADQLKGALNALNTQIVTTPGLLSPLVSGFAALGVPMAGLAALAVPITLGIAAVVISFDNLNKYFTSIDTGIHALGERIDKINAATEGTTGQAIGSMEQKLADLTRAKKDLDDLQKTSDAQFTKDAGHFGDLGARYAESKDPNFNALQASIEKKKQDIQDLEDDLRRIGDNVAQGDTNFADQQATAAEKRREAARKEEEATKVLLELAADKGQAELEQAALLKLTSEGAKQRNLDLASERIALEESRKVLVDSGDTSQAVKDKIKVYDEALQRNAEQTAYLTTEAMYLIQVREAEAEAIKKTQGALEDWNKAQEAFDKQTTAAQVQHANQIEAATLKKEQQEQQYTAGSIQDTYERTRIATEENRKEIAVKQATADKITDLQIKLTNDQNRVSEEFGRKVQEDQIDYWQDLAKLGREAGYKQREDAIDHVQKLADIQKKQADGESDALYDRNFRELAKLQSHKDTAIQEENRAFEERQNQLKRHAQDQIAERTIQLNEEIAAQRRASIVKIQELAQREQQQELVERNAAQRKITALEVTERQQIQDLVTTQQYKITILQQGYRNELALLILQEEQRQKIIAATLQSAQTKALQNLQPSIRPPGLVDEDGIRMFAQGGNFGANEWFGMSENETERLDIGGQGYNVAGAALVYPLQSGSVTNSQQSKSSGNTFSFPITIYGSTDPEQTAQMVDDKIAARMEMVFGD